MAPANQGGGSADLFSRRIERLALISDAGRVVVPHSSNARYATSADGRSWVRKRQGESS